MVQLLQKGCLLILAVFIGVLPAQNSQAQAFDQYLGQVMLVGFGFCPNGWLEANGALLDISTFPSLFSLYGVQFGGDGRTTFGLPDLQGRIPIHRGQGDGRSNYIIGQQGGAQAVTLVTSEIPAHTHQIQELTTRDGGVSGVDIRSGGGPQDRGTSNTGQQLAHENRPPYLTLRYCISTIGIFPSRP